MTKTILSAIVLLFAWNAAAACPTGSDVTVEQPYAAARNWCIPEPAPRCEFRFANSSGSTIVEETGLALEQILSISPPTNMFGLGSIEAQCFDVDDTPGEVRTYVARFRGPRAPFLIP